MSTNYTGFSPNAQFGESRYQTEITYISGDAKGVLEVKLCEVPCTGDNSCIASLAEDDSSIWNDLDLSDYYQVRLYIRSICDDSLRDTLIGAALAPLKNGMAIFSIEQDTFFGTTGEFEGEVEVEYYSGRIVTAVDLVKFNVISDFSGNIAVMGND